MLGAPVSLDDDVAAAVQRMRAERNIADAHRYQHPALRGRFVTRVSSDAQFAALAIEHELAVYSADTDVARFAELT